MLKFNGRDWQRWWNPLLSIAVLLAVLLLFFPFDTGYTALRDPLGKALWATWTASETPGDQDYSYCLLVPLIVVFLIIERKAILVRIPINGSTVALAWIILGLVMFWIGSRAGKQYIGCGAIQVLLAGFIFWFWGGAMFRQLRFAWVFLVFAWPLPFLDASIAFPLRLIVSNLAFRTLNLIGIPCLLNGTALYSAANPAHGWQIGDRFQIDISDPCSGLHSLLPLLMFSAAYSYFFLPRRWQQWTVFLSAIPCAIIANVIRILLLVFGCMKWGTPSAMGPADHPSLFHEGCGFATFMLALVLESSFGYFLVKIGQRYPLEKEKIEPKAGSSSRAESEAVPRWRSKTVYALAILMLVVSWYQTPHVLSEEAGILTALPNQVNVSDLDGGSFFGLDAPVTDVERNVLPKDTIFSRKSYDDFHGHTIFFSIVLSGLQQYTIHPPQVCLLAQGWTITSEENVPVQLANGRTLVVRNLSIQRQAVSSTQQPTLIHAYYMYWYVTDGISTPSRATRNWLSSWDRVVHNRDHRWAYVIAMSPITESLRPDGLNAEQTKKMLQDFIREIVPTFQKSEMPGATSEKP